ncbi:MAG: sigma-70 family RNA polymerase sigma factor [Bacillota bacterium]|nr:sigma-70 family RNA polymerase sigma factor [Bacillota bacterium]
MRPELEQAVTYLQKPGPQNVQEAIRLLQQTLFSFSMKICGHHQDAEDTMQDVLVSSLPHLAKIREPRALSVWLYTAAKRRCWRKRRKSPHPLRLLTLEELMPDKDELEALRTGASSDPESESIRRQDLKTVQEAVLGLPLPYRIVLVLHDMEDLDTEQIAQVLSLKPGTVRVRLHRARLLVRQQLSRHRSTSRKTARKRSAKSRGQRSGRVPACHEIFANLSDYLDGRLPQKDCTELQDHIEACPQCVLFIQDLKRAIDRCRSLDLPTKDHLGAALRRQLTEEYLRLLQHPSSPHPL